MEDPIAFQSDFSHTESRSDFVKCCRQGATNIEMKNIDLVKKICSLTGYEPKIEFVKDRLGHDHRYSVSSEKISSVGIIIKTDINEELEETILSLKDEK